MRVVFHFQGFYASVKGYSSWKMQEDSDSSWDHLPGQVKIVKIHIL